MLVTVLIAILSLTSHTSDAAISAHRDAGERYEDLLSRSLDPRQGHMQSLGGNERVWDRAQSLTPGAVDLRLVPEWDASLKALEEAFQRIRDHRYLPDYRRSWFGGRDPSTHHRRIPWLFSGDYCWSRAEESRRLLESFGLKGPAKLFVFGNLSASAPPTSAFPTHLYTYHVAVAYRVGERVLVLDPSLQPNHPLVLESWLERLNVYSLPPQKSGMKVVSCDGAAYGPESRCEGAEPPSDAERMSSLQEALEREHHSLYYEAGELDADSLLGDEPPWQQKWHTLRATALPDPGFSWALGPYNTCAFRESSLSCTGPQSMLVDRPGANPSSSLTDIAIGLKRHCVVEAGKLRCKGVDPNFDRSAKSFSKVTQPAFDASSERFCASTEKGVQCSAGSGAFSNTFVPNPLASGRADQLVGGNNFFCGLLNHRAYCWWHSSLDISPPIHLPPAYSIGAGFEHACALAGPTARERFVQCWGSNAFGQTALPDQLGHIRGLAVGGRHTCVHGFDGQVRCWGDNTYGQTHVPKIDGEVREIRAAAYHTCAKTDEKVVCWGLNLWEQLAFPVLAE